MHNSEKEKRCLQRDVNDCEADNKGKIGRASSGREGSLFVILRHDSIETDEARGLSILLNQLLLLLAEVAVEGFCELLDMKNYVKKKKYTTHKTHETQTVSQDTVMCDCKPSFLFFYV